MRTRSGIHAAVADELLSGTHPPGAWIRQDDLADRLGVSKIPVREALHRLAERGVVEFAPNRGVRVPELTADAAVEIFALRRSIEVLLLERAVPRFTKVDLATAEMALDDADSPAGNWRFHEALCRPSGWDRGLAVAAELHLAVAPYVHRYVSGLGGAETSSAEHEELFDAAVRGDVGTLARVTREHLDGAERVVLDSLARGAS